MRLRPFVAAELLALRERSGLTQAGFARLIGVSRKTLENWEQGRRTPNGAARVLLLVLAREWDAVLRALR